MAEDDPRHPLPEPRRGEHDQDHDERPQAPQELCEGDEAPATRTRSRLADHRDGGGHVRSHGEADDDDPDEEHRRSDRAHDPQEPERVEEQVEGVHPLATDPVADASAHDRADADADRERGGEEADLPRVERELRLPQREARTHRDDRSGIEVGRHARQEGRAPRRAGLRVDLAHGGSGLGHREVSIQRVI